jgi:predicted DNA-binding protein (MmcQ/YjbR family)
MTLKEVHDYLMIQDGVYLDYPFGEGVAVYKIKGSAEREGDSDKMFAIVREKGEPLQISLKCDPQLAELLREKYESVMPGYHLNKKHWNTILLTGQVPWEDVQGLMVHAHELIRPKN